MGSLKLHFCLWVCAKTFFLFSTNFLIYSMQIALELVFTFNTYPLYRLLNLSMRKLSNIIIWWCRFWGAINSNLNNIPYIKLQTTVTVKMKSAL